MSRSTRTSSAILRIVCFVLLLAVALLQMRYALHQQLMFVGGGDESTILHSRNATQLTNLAREKHLFEADLEQASLLLQKALSASPLYVPAWLALAVVRNDQGESAQSIQILAYAHHLTRASSAGGGIRCLPPTNWGRQPCCPWN
jgi:Tfp pilus assembly protein PilF